MKKFEGFSLIELLISFAIITLFILGTAQLLLYSLAIKSSCANNMSAAGISRTKLEYFKLKFGVKAINETIIHLMDRVEYQDILKRNPSWEEAK